MAESFDEGLWEKSASVIGSEVETVRNNDGVVDRSRLDKIGAAEEELQSLEYEDDWFYSVAANNPTPSFDEVEGWSAAQTVFNQLIVSASR